MLTNFRRIATMSVLALAVGATIISCGKDVEKVEVTPTTKSIEVGKTAQLSATVTPSDAKNADITWSSSDATVATVDQNGRVSAVAVGATVITAEAGGKTGSCAVTVIPAGDPGPDPTSKATIILAAGDVWGDGTGYQMLLDADHNALGDIIPTTGALSSSGNVPSSTYAAFEYKIPTNADGNLSTSNIVFDNSVTIAIPAGTYDYCITNPTPGDKMWIASGNYGRYNDFVFEAGKTYRFTVSANEDTGNDQVTLTINGVAAKSAFIPNGGLVRTKATK
ncbi:MAG: DUF2436 domain-containing protein [Bacteroidales bacterium]|nr:DUF2436 domain-containing protein [Bacteroidales bacterium]